MAKVIVEVKNLQNTDLIGRIVISKAGRDKGQLYVIINKKDDLFFLANGKNKTIEMPKCKKSKHIILTEVTVEDLRESIVSQEKNTNLKIKRFIKLNGSIKEV